MWIILYCTPEPPRDCWKKPLCAALPRRKPNPTFWSSQTCWAASWHRPCERTCVGPAAGVEDMLALADTDNTDNQSARTRKTKQSECHCDQEQPSRKRQRGESIIVVHTHGKKKQQRAYTGPGITNTAKPPQLQTLPHTEPVQTCSNTKQWAGIRLPSAQTAHGLIWKKWNLRRTNHYWRN